MRFSLGNLLLTIALLAVAMGWWCDHRRLENANDRLNREAAYLFNRLTMREGSSGVVFPDGKLPPNRAYDFSKAEDRAEYAKNRSGVGFMPLIEKDYLK